MDGMGLLIDDGADWLADALAEQAADIRAEALNEAALYGPAVFIVVE